MWEIKQIYYWWNKNPIHNIVHWTIFLAIVIIALNSLITKISIAALETQGIENYASTTRALLDVDH